MLREQLRLDGGDERLARGRVQVLQAALVLLVQPRLDVLQIVGDVRLLHVPRALRQVERGRLVQERFLEAGPKRRRAC